MVVLTAAACSFGSEDGTDPEFAEIFAMADTLELEQPPGDTIAQIGATDVADDGRLLIADRYLQRVRMYDSNGRLLASQGRFGEGPFEYHSINSVAFSPDGRVFVNDVRSARYTILSADLEPDTTRRMELGAALPGTVDAFADGVVQIVPEPGETPGGALAAWSLYYRSPDGDRPWRVDAAPERLLQAPYWGSFSRSLIAAAGDTLFVGNSLLYPIEMFDSEGRSLGTIGTPPPSYREPPEFERGQFAFQDPAEAVGMQSRLREYGSAFRVLSGMYVVAGRWLIVAHARFPEEKFPYISQYDEQTYGIDLYDLQSGEKVVEDLPWREGWWILGGGPHLHALVSEPPEPWRVVRLEVLLGSGSP
ncbi:MAG: hypothetical protein WD960_10920 [Gemmatimonadota bacterium]